MPDAVDQVTIVPILEGEQVLGTKLVSYGLETGLAVKIPRGLRAVSVGVTRESGVTGLIKPGDFVDLLGTFEFGSMDKSDQRTYTLLQGVLVLAVDQNLGIESEVERAMGVAPEMESPRGLFGGGAQLGSLRMERPTVTLGLPPDQVQRVVMAQESGYLYLSLRSMFEDRVAVQLESVGIKELLGIQEKVYVTPPRWREYRGGAENY